MADEFSGAVIEALTVRKGEVSCLGRVLPPNLWCFSGQRHQQSLA